MIRRPALPGGYTVFADDIRHEINGKMTLVGTYATELSFLAPPPGRITRLAALIVFRDNLNSEARPLKLLMYRDLPEREVLFEVEIELPVLTWPEDDPLPTDDPNAPRFGELRMAVQLEGLEIPEPCRIKVRGFIDGDEVHLGGIRIRFAPQPPEGSASPAS